MVRSIQTGSPFGLTTAGGEEVRLLGEFFGHSQRLVKEVPDALFWPAAEYKSFESNVTFQAASCVVVQDYHEISCKSVPGFGKDYHWRVRVGGQWSEWSIPTTTYAAPTISSFENEEDGLAATAASTSGNEVITIRYVLSSQAVICAIWVSPVSLPTLVRLLQRCTVRPCRR